MIGYVTLGTNDIEKARTFYDALFGSIGATRKMEFDGGFTLYGVQPLSFAADPYDSFWAGSPWADIKAIPFDRMQVLDSGPEQRPYTGPAIGNRCAPAL